MITTPAEQIEIAAVKGECEEDDSFKHLQHLLPDRSDVRIFRAPPPAILAKPCCSWRFSAERELRTSNSPAITRRLTRSVPQVLHDPSPLLRYLLFLPQSIPLLTLLAHRGIPQVLLIAFCGHREIVPQIV